MMYIRQQRLEYFKHPAWSRSELMEIGFGSPRKALLKKMGQLEYDDSPSLRIGSAIHTAFLEGEDVFDQVYADKKDARTKIGKFLNAENEAAGWVLLSEQETAAIWDMVNVANSYDDVVQYKQGNVEIEKEIYFNYCGVSCKAKLDIINHDMKVICDFKTTTDASPDAFTRSIRKFGYDAQGAFYRQALYETTGELYDYHIVAVEKTAPYDYLRVSLSDETLRNGLSMIDCAILNLQHFKENGFPTYNHGRILSV